MAEEQKERVLEQDQNEVYINFSDNELNSELLKEIINEHYETKVSKYLLMYDLYKGDHDINYRVGKENKPNNKLVNNFYGQIVDDVTGYFLGKPVVVNVEDEDINTALDFILQDNDINDTFLEIGKECSIKGKSALMVYQDEDSRTNIVRLPAEECIFVYNRSKSNQLDYVLRVYEYDIVGEDDKIRYVEAYDKDKVTYYVEAEGEYVLDSAKDLNPQAHIYGAIPIIPIINNEEEMGDFEKVTSLVNDYDKVLSDQSNEHEAYRNAYLVLKNMIANNDTLKKLKEQGILEIGDGGEASFLTKDVQTEAVETHLNRIQDNVYRFAQIPNLSDEKFAGNLSGVAIKFKLFSLENKCIIKERKFTRAIKQLLKILSEPIRVATGKVIDMTTVEIQFTRNIPNNLVELTEVVSKLNGIVDAETLLALLPFVDNPKDVLEKLQDELDAYAKDKENNIPPEDEQGAMDDFNTVEEI